MQVPAIELDRPGMWAPKIAQSRARAQEATSLPRAPSVMAGAAQDSAAAQEPAAAAMTAAPKQCAAALAALSDQVAEGALSLQVVTEAFPAQAAKAPIDLPSQPRETASSSERQLESRTATAHPPALSPEPERDTAAQAQHPAVPADNARPPTAQPAHERLPECRRAQAQPARSAPLQGSHVNYSKERRKANAALGARKALSSPLILPSPDLAGEIRSGSQGEQAAGAVSQPAPSTKLAPVAQEAAAVEAQLMCSPFMQTLAQPDGLTPSVKLPGDVPASLSACIAGAESPSDHLQSSPSHCSQDSLAATLPGKLTAADRCTGGSAELAKTKVRQLSRQNSAICLPPKKRLQKRRCGRGTPPPSGEEPVAGQASHAAILAAHVSPSAAAEPATVTGSGRDTGGRPSAAEQVPVAEGQITEAQPAAAEQGATANAPVAAGKPRRRPGRPLGTGKAARARALELPACSPEGRRPLKKSRKALEAEQVSCC